MGVVEYIESWPGVMVHIGLGKPHQRAFAAVALAGITSYAVGMPKKAFDTETGRVKSDFFLIPLSVGAAVALFT